MRELIYKDEAYKAIDNCFRDGWYRISPADAKMNIHHLVSDANEANRPQGKWIRTAEEYIGDDISGFYDYHWACSECGKEAIINNWNIYELSDYCPHCGAKMKGAGDE
jgi:rRNA maturation protein Nop10